MKKIIMALLAVILIVLFFSTFIEKNNVDKNQEEDGISVSVTNLNFNIEKITDFKDDTENIICATSRGLVKSNNNNEIVPDIADDIEISKDGIEYNFKLKDDLYWSDGKKIKAEDILSYFKWLIKYDDEKDITALLNVYGVKNFKDGKGAFEKDVALTSDGDNIKIRLNKRNDNFLLELAKPQYRIRRDLFLWNDIKSNYKNISYCGEYYISNVLEDEIEFKKNSGEGRKLLLIKDDNKEDAMASYEIGERDVVVDPPVSQSSRLDKTRRILSSSSGRGIYMAINSKNEDVASRKEIVKLFYRAAENYYENNKKAVKFSEGSYFEKDMTELDKLQSRKVSINSDEKGTVPGKINMLIEDNDAVEDFSKSFEDYMYENEDINIEYEKRDKGDMSDYKDFDIVLFTARDDPDNRNELYSDMQKFFTEENARYFMNTSKIEENLFNSYSIVPIMFINRNIAISDKISNIKLDGNGNVDFEAIN